MYHYYHRHSTISMITTVIEGLTGGCRGATPPNVFAPFGNSANSAISSYHSVNSAIVLSLVAVFSV